MKTFPQIFYGILKSAVVLRTKDQFYETMWNVNLMQQGNFIDIFLARHALGTYAAAWVPRSGSQDHHPSKNSVQKTICCNSTSNVHDDVRMYPKHAQLRIYQQNYLVESSWRSRLFHEEDARSNNPSVLCFPKTEAHIKTLNAYQQEIHSADNIVSIYRCQLAHLLHLGTTGTWVCRTSWRRNNANKHCLGSQVCTQLYS